MVVRLRMEGTSIRDVVEVHPNNRIVMDTRSGY